MRQGLFLHGSTFYFLPNIAFPAIIVSRNNTIKIKNKILAKTAAPAAIPVNPNSAATNAITKKIAAQRNIIFSFKFIISFY